jgi:large repetitive protein
LKAPTPLALMGVLMVACASGSPQPSRSRSAETPISSPLRSQEAKLEVKSTGYNLSAPIQRALAVWQGSKVYIAGGLDADGTTVGGVFSLDPVSGRLTPLGTLPQPVHDAAAAMIAGRLVVFAGGSGAGTNTVQIFDPSTDKAWIAGHMPVALSDLAAAQIGSTTYLIGGYDGTAPRREIYATSDGTTFRLVGRLPVGLRYPAATGIDGRIMIVGGDTTSGPTASILVFDPSTGRVSRIGQLPYAVGHASAFGLGSFVYVVGGRNAADTSTRRSSMVDPVGGEVTALPPLAGPLADSAVASGPDSVLLVGGWGKGTLSQVLRASLHP